MRNGTFMHEANMVSAKILRAAALSALLCGCNGGAGGVAHLDPVSGDGQSGTVATALAQPLIVKATDGSGNPVPGVSVTWTADAGGGSFTSGTVNTGMDGQTQVAAILGKTAGMNRFTASTGLIMGRSISFTATGTPGPAVSLTKGSGDGQTGTAGAALPQPFLVTANDQYGNAVPGASIKWTSSDGGGSVSAPSTTTGADGTTSAVGTLGPAAMKNVFQATLDKAQPVSFSATRKAFKLSYKDPPAGGKLRLVKNAASTDSKVVLDVVVGPGTTLTGYAVGFNLPVDASKVALDPMTPLTPGKGLSPGTAPVAAKAVLPSDGPLKGTLVSALSQKGAGAGAVVKDMAVPGDTVLYTLQLGLVPDGATGMVFDGTAAGFKLKSGGMRDRSGMQVVEPADVAIGKLEVVK